MAEHMQEIARSSIQGLLASLYGATGHRPNLEASCEFLGEVIPSTGLIVRRTQKRRAISVFLFKFESGGSCAYFVSSARRDNVLDRGVPIPKEISSALSATCLEAKLHATVAELTFDHELDVEAFFIGAPKQFTLCV